MEKERKCSGQYGALEETQVDGGVKQEPAVFVQLPRGSAYVTRRTWCRWPTPPSRCRTSKGELVRIERIRDILVRRESELRYMMDDIQLCKEITRLKNELQKLVSVPDKDKSKEDREREEELLLQINKLVETRDFLVDDVEFERLREREEDREMAAFLQSKFPKAAASAKGALPDQTVASKSQQTSTPFISKTGVTLLKDCCGFTCSVM
ncbi:unnamed protein product [Pleuronectes platessa]|uniref:BMERB domain-containing protein n=1 Tax=Pleuronectes platessa TaxID=8262 RepID=A0A9N7UN94_PLEPL|nr:unnamed protein product [Pleuronectes platessa]